MGNIRLAVLLIMCAASAWPQAYSGSLTGVITDSSGGVVQQAAVKMTELNRGYTLDTVSDTTGRYLLRSLAPGSYRLSVSAPGFRAFVRQGIVLDIGQNASLDVSLQVGEVTSTVTVAGEAALLDTGDPTTGQTLNRTFINDLPLLGRNVLDLARLTPGVTRAAGQGYGTEQQNNFVANGGRNSTADVLIEGVSVNTFGQHGGVQVTLDVPSVDAVEEFKVQSNFSADISGFSGATVVNMIVRSGTNAFHGSAWEFVRNNVLAANDWFSNSVGGKLPPRRFNQFGATVSGPIKKNKTFYFVDYEGFRQRNPATLRAGVPSAAMREGDFAEVCAAGFSASGMCGDPNGQLWDPYSAVFDAARGGPVRQQFIPFNNLARYQSPGNPKLAGTPYQLPSRAGNLIDPVAAKMIKHYPMPNLGVGTPGYNRFNNWLLSVSNVLDKNQGDVKIDHLFNDNNRLSGRFAPRRQHGVKANLYKSPLDPYSQGDQNWNAYSLALNFTRTLNPQTVLNISAGYIINPVFSGKGVLATDYPDYDPITELGLPSYFGVSGVRETPAISLGNYLNTSGLSIGTLAWGQYRQSPETYHLVASIGRVQGRHDLRFGWESRMHRISFSQPTAPAGQFNFGFNGTSQFPASGGGDAMASFLIGSGVGGSGTYEVPTRIGTQSFQFAGFLQDNWRVSDRLTLNLGLRYDISTPRTERFDRMSRLDPDIASPLQVPGLAPLRGAMLFASPEDRHVTGADYNDFGPRFGFAYRLQEKFVMRGGYGLFYSVPRNGASGIVGGGYQGFIRSTPWITTYQNDGATPWSRLSDPFPGTGPLLPIGSSLGTSSFIGDAVSGPFRNVHPTPYEQSWIFGFQREVPGHIVLEANYVGTKGTKLYFGGASQFNHLGPEVAGASADQISALNRFVPNPFAGIITQGQLTGPTIQAWRLQVPFPQYTSFAIDERPAASSSYHSLQVRLDKRLSQGVQVLVTYTLSKSIDDASNQGLTTFLGGSSSLQDPNNRRLERSLSLFDSTHVLNLSYSWQLPIGTGKRIGGNWNSWVNGLLGGWNTNAIWQFASGQPINLTLTGGQSLPTYGAQRPNLTGTLTRNDGPDYVRKYFANPEVAVRPAPFSIGYAPRTMPNLRAPGIGIANLSLFKQFSLNKLREAMRLEYRVEGFNAFNRPHFCAPNRSVNSGTFGQITGMCSAPREVQMGLKLYW